MEVDSKEVINAEVYEIDSYSHSYLWDFGSFVLHGQLECPLDTPSSIYYYQMIVMSQDEDMNHVCQKEVNFYIFDYSSYFETKIENATHLISQDNIIYRICERKIEGGKFVIKDEKPTGTEEGIIINDLSDWKPVKKLD